MRGYFQSFILLPPALLSQRLSSLNTPVENVYHINFSNFMSTTIELQLQIEDKMEAQLMKSKVT
jgi:hypothetical protein